VAATGLGLIAAGCGSSKAPSVANIATTGAAATSTSSTGASATKPSRAAFALCLGSHGFAASVGSGGNGNLSIAGVVVSGHVDPSSPQFQAAMRACSKFLPGGGPPSETPAERAAAAAAMLSFARCMRQNGVPGFPDPNGSGMFAPGSLKGIDPGSPLTAKAFKACESLEPKVGPRLQL
jgi:hypothetical protein